MKKVFAGLYESNGWYIENFKCIGLWALYPSEFYCTSRATEFGLYQSKAAATAGFATFTESEEGQAALDLAYRMTH